MLRRCAFPAWFFIVLDLFPDTFSACMRCVNFNFVYFWSYPDLFPHTEKRHLSYLSNILQSKPPVKRVVWESPIRAYCGHCPLSGLRKVCQLHFILSYPLRGILFYFLLFFFPVNGSTDSNKLNWSFAISSCNWFLMYSFILFLFFPTVST